MNKRFTRACIVLGVMVLSIIQPVMGQENKDGFPTPEQVIVAGSLQSEVGCPDDWQPACATTALTFVETDALWTGTFNVPAGAYEYKIALDGGWDRNYGVDAAAGGANIPLVVEADSAVTFSYDHATGVVTAAFDGAAAVPDTAVVVQPALDIPTSVTIAGNLNPAMGCMAEWLPECADAMLEYDTATDVWSKTFALPAGSYEYKVAINGTWDENYGGSADAGGANIALTVPADGDVTFFYDHKTHWVADTVRSTIVTAPGDYQTFLGCASNDDPGCMASWLQDPEGDNIFTLSTTLIPAGTYSAQFAIGRSSDTLGEPVSFTVDGDGTNVSFTYDAGLNLMVVSTGGAAVSSADLRTLGAYWVTADTILWDMAPVEGVEYKLLTSATGNIKVDLFGLAGDYQTIDLIPGAGDFPTGVAEKFPHLANLPFYTLTNPMAVSDALRGQVAIAGFAADQVVSISGLQIPGVLDDLYTTDAPLGVHFDAAGVPTLSVWAPTASSVEFLLFADSAPATDAEVLPMTRDDATGVWSITGDAAWKDQFYQYRVSVFAPSVMENVVNDVTDPYSISLSVNSLRSQIVDLDDAALKPAGWDAFVKPAITPEDITVYELHIRDFSAYDETVPTEQRGTYSAFSLPDASGTLHLTQLAAAGLTHLHLLPTFDIATINENRKRWFDVDPATLAGLAPDSEEQQAALSEIRDLDGFNWGYDPYHYMAPEGSYSLNPDGSARILEYRQMVQAIGAMGLYVVQDVVFNHTNSSGQANRSVLDKVVPGYYHRLNDTGMVERSTCCENTATEHNMMRRLMVDTIVLMAKYYKIDAFRFDLMGHHMLADMLAVRAALDALTVENDGVDGTGVYLYGEGWNFGEVADNARGVQATQLNIAGSGIGVFNDRLRDAVRGGSPFGDREKQGLSNGVFSLPNGLSADNESLPRLLQFMDQARVGLAGNLRDFSFMDRNGDIVTGADVDYNGSPTGYTSDPQENIIYIDKHDNETLYDNNIYKAPDGTSMADRVRMQILGNAFVLYAQGVPFMQAGTDLLRSKSMDRNSYNSGDWFNRLDFTYQTNNFGVGLPPSGDNSAEWARMQPFLADPANVPTSEDILATTARWQDMLRVRYSSPLFRLTTGAEVMQKLSFLNVGPDQQAGVLVMVLDDTVGDDLDANVSKIVVIFNTTGESITFAAMSLAGTFELHSDLVNGADELLKTASFADGTFTVPMLSAAVFVGK